MTNSTRQHLYRRTRGAPLGDDAIAAAEASVGARLPASFLALLRDQNGGDLGFDHLPRADGEHLFVSRILPLEDAIEFTETARQDLGAP